MLWVSTAISISLRAPIPCATSTSSRYTPLPSTISEKERACWKRWRSTWKVAAVPSKRTISYIFTATPCFSVWSGYKPSVPLIWKRWNTACRCWSPSKSTSCARAACKSILSASSTRRLFPGFDIAAGNRPFFQHVARFMHRDNVNAKSMQLEPGARENIAHRAHLLIPDPFFLRLFQQFAATRHRSLGHFAVTVTCQQGFIGTIIGMRFENGLQDIDLAGREFLLVEQPGQTVRAK